jgi:hypothetical protein
MRLGPAAAISVLRVEEERSGLLAFDLLDKKLPISGFSSRTSRLAKWRANPQSSLSNATLARKPAFREQEDDLVSYRITGLLEEGGRAIWLFESVGLFGQAHGSTH